MERPFQEMLEALANLAGGGVLDRIDHRAKRARELRQWGLHPRHPEPGSPLAADDAAFEAAYPLTLAGDAAVSEECLFPIMNATENLYAAALLVDQRPKTGDLYASSIMQLCRSAMETSARTIWLLSSPDRNVRLDRCMSIEMEQLEQQSYFLKLEAEFERSGRNPRPQNIIDDNDAHRAKHAALLERVKEAYSYTKSPSFTKTITQAAKWVDEHVPAHDSGELAGHGLEQGARSFYSYGSSFVHGYSWMTDYARGGVLFGMIADGFAAALNMTECAVCLYEAVCRCPGAQRAADGDVPDHLEPTISAWSNVLFTQ
ncbi:hypothetical protein [Mycolicibacterium hippocampi]|uniref:hypothetical protein n=1 Tax=Mycolicibacterium hippocampi TaxID=659824 RepID=UPI003515DDCF